MIELTALHKSYSLPDGNQIAALKGVHLSIQPGEVFGIIGESGAGKSTLIRCINHLEAPDSGKIIIDGKDLTTQNKAQLRETRRKIGMIFQHFNLLSSRTVYQNISFPLELIGVKPAQIKQKVRDLLNLVGLSERQNHYPSALSGGQKQRVAIARALANNPSLLLSDEATSALDPETKHHILQLLKKINTDLGLTIILITHEMSVIKEICHRLAVLEDGRIVAESPVLEFFGRPQTTIAKKFARSFALHDLPENLKARLTDNKIEQAIPLWRLSFLGRAAEAPLISQVSRLFSLDLSILQAQIEQIRDETVGVLLVEANGTPENILRGKQYLHEKAIFIEELGYVRSLD